METTNFIGFQIKRRGAVISSTIPGDCEEKDLIIHAVDAYGFLIPNDGRSRTASEFAALIRRYTSHPRSKAIATALDKVESSPCRDRAVRRSPLD